MAYMTIGAISGHFPDAEEREQNERLASMSYGAEVERIEDAAEALARTVRMLDTDCATCGSPMYAGRECQRCEQHRHDPRMVLHTDGTWWDRAALAEESDEK